MNDVEFKQMTRLISGIQPTNFLTLGNYLGSIKNWVDLQYDYECFFMIVDQHAITNYQDPKKLYENTLFSIAVYIASGIDYKKSNIFIQSHIPQHSQLSWVLNCFSYIGELSRMTQYKDKTKKTDKNISSSLLFYPVLMAADILLYDIDLVPVGIDQKQHIELTRNLAMRLNNLYDKKIFKIPKAYIPNYGAKIMDLQNPNNKMSKSSQNHKGTILISDLDDQIFNKIKSAVTDSENSIRFDPIKKPGISNMLNIQASILGKDINYLEDYYRGKYYSDLKKDTADIVVNAISPIRDKTYELIKDKTELIKNININKIRSIAEIKLKNIYDTIGFVKSF